MSFKSGFISLIGRPNVGKSSLLNELVGGKVSIVTSKAQTTRNNIRGILTKKDEYQMVFVDTPGVHTTRNELDSYMNASAFKSTKDVDLILFLAPANEKIGRNDLFLLQELKKKPGLKFLVITKSDAVTKNELIEKLNEWSHLAAGQFSEIIPLSAFTGFNLETLKTLILQNLPENEYQFYDGEVVTDQSQRFLVREIIRENVLLKTGQEIPHSVAILVDELSETDEIVKIVATIVVERSSQKGIIIGHQGAKIKDIKYKTRKQLNTMWNKKVELELFVKVKENWRSSASLIKKMGYDKDKY